MFKKATQGIAKKLNLKRKNVYFGIIVIVFVYIMFIYLIQTLRYATSPYNNGTSFGKVFSYTLHHGVPFSVIAILTVIVIVMLIFLFWQRGKTLKKDERDFNYSKSGVYGTAGLLDEIEMEGTARIQSPARADGIILGQMDVSGRRLITRDPKSRNISNQNIAVFGAPGSGKTFTLVKPAILQLCKRRESIVLTDPKGELYRDSVEYLKSYGYTIRRFDLVHLTYSDGWDVLNEIANSKYTDQQKAERAQIAAEIIMNNNGTNQDKNIFYKSQLSLLKAAILRVVFGNDYGDGEECTDKKTLAAAYNILNDPTGDLDKYFEIDEHPEISQATQAYNSFKQSSPNAYGNIVSGLATSLNLMQIEAVQKITTNDNIDMILPGEKPCAYFLVMSDTHSTYQFLSSLFFSFLFMDLTEYADQQITGSLKVPVNFLLDEFANIGTIPDFDKKMATVRSRALNVMIIVQNIAQLKQMYLNTWTSILSCCATQIALSINDEDTAQYFSDRSGEATVQVKTERHQAYESFFVFSHQKSTGEGKRTVFTADELMRMDPNDSVVIFQGKNCLKAKKYPVSDHPEYKKMKPVLVKDIVPSIEDEDARAVYYAQEEERVLAYERKISNGFIPENQCMKDEPDNTESIFSSAGNTVKKFQEAVSTTWNDRQKKMEKVKDPESVRSKFSSGSLKFQKADVIDLEEYEELKKEENFMEDEAFADSDLNNNKDNVDNFQDNFDNENEIEYELDISDVFFDIENFDEEDNERITEYTDDLKVCPWDEKQPGNTDIDEAYENNNDLSEYSNEEFKDNQPTIDKNIKQNKNNVVRETTEKETEKSIEKEINKTKTITKEKMENNDSALPNVKINSNSNINSLIFSNDSSSQRKSQKRNFSKMQVSDMNTEDSSSESNDQTSAVLSELESNKSPDDGKKSNADNKKSQKKNSKDTNIQKNTNKKDDTNNNPNSSMRAPSSLLINSIKK